MNLPINQIKLNPRNPRIIRDDNFKKLCESIRHFPQMLELRPLVLDENNIVLGGNMRLKACQELGMQEVPVIYAKDLTEEQKKEFVIKDNVAFGTWDFDVLSEDFNTNLLEEFGLDFNLDKEIDFDNIESNEEIEKQFKKILISCPSCNHTFEVRI